MPRRAPGALAARRGEPRVLPAALRTLEARVGAQRHQAQPNLVEVEEVRRGHRCQGAPRLRGQLRQQFRRPAVAVGPAANGHPRSRPSHGSCAGQRDGQFSQLHPRLLDWQVLRHLPEARCRHGRPRLLRREGDHGLGDGRHSPASVQREDHVVLEAGAQDMGPAVGVDLQPVPHLGRLPVSNVQGQLQGEDRRRRVHDVHHQRHEGDAKEDDGVHRHGQRHALGRRVRLVVPRGGHAEGHRQLLPLLGRAGGPDGVLPGDHGLEPVPPRGPGRRPPLLLHHARRLPERHLRALRPRGQVRGRLLQAPGPGREGRPARSRGHAVNLGHGLRWPSLPRCRGGRAPLGRPSPTGKGARRARTPRAEACGHAGTQRCCAAVPPRPRS
mmetsp:Transcript_158060/g.484412  ORF Transcript_158060/g.484412 Transcript_158060/m.484412 type:complete len:384 (+) Transcript_158060:339-1490(+)